VVIANAIFFKGDWLHQFAKGMTRQLNFYIDERQVTKVQMMSQRKLLRVGFDNKLAVHVVNLPYTNCEISMNLLVPTARFGLKAVEANLFYKKLQSLSQNLNQQDVFLSMPKMKLEFELDLIPALQSLGIRDVFDEMKANLSGISGKQDLFVSKVYHKAFLEVNEEGTEAAAATAVVVTKKRSAGRPKPEPLKITCDHPFIFLIMHNSTKSILFMGRFASPIVTALPL